MSTQLWYEQLSGKSWTGLWSGYTICGHCRGIRKFEGACHVCGDPPFDFTPRVILEKKGKEHKFPAVFMGAEGRYEDYVYLGMMEREWNRPAPGGSFSGTSAISQPSD